MCKGDLLLKLVPTFFNLKGSNQRQQEALLVSISVSMNTSLQVDIAANILNSTFYNGEIRDSNEQIQEIILTASREITCSNYAILIAKLSLSFTSKWTMNGGSDKA